MGQAHAVVNLFIIIAPLVLGVALSVAMVNARSHPSGTAMLTLALFGVGFALFAAAKLSVLRQGHLLSLGSRLMSPASRRLYRLGYGLMIVATFLTIGLVMAETLVARSSAQKAVPGDKTPAGATGSAPSR